MTLGLRYTAVSDVGRLRTNNEDSGYAGAHLLVVADGMGGGPAGDLASAVAVQTLRQLDATPSGDVLEALSAAITQANERLADLIADDPRLDGTGSTITAVLFDGQRIGLAHLGDSRGYLLRDGELSRLTHDHTFVQTLIDEGRISENEARHHPHRSVILRVLDGQPDVSPDLTLHDVRPGDRLLLCSDGLAGVVTDESIAAKLADGTPDSAALELVELALAAGGPDNITCVVADVVDEDTTPPSDGLAMLLVGAAAEQPRGPMGSAGSPRADTGELPPVAGSDPEELRYAPRPPKRFRWLRRLAVVVVVLALLAAGARLAYDWSQRQYYIATAGDRVAIFRGVQAQLPGISLSHLYEAQDLVLTQLPQYAQERVSGGIDAGTLNDARSTVAELRNLAAQCARATAAATARTSPGKTPATPTQTTGPNCAGVKPTTTPTPTP